jgi:hypothetical protein
VRFAYGGWQVFGGESGGHVFVVPSSAELDEAHPATLSTHVHSAGQSLSAAHGSVFAWQYLAPLGAQPLAASPGMMSTPPASTTGTPSPASAAAGGTGPDEPDDPVAPPPVVPGVTVPEPVLAEPEDPELQHIIISAQVKPWPQSAST